MGIMSGDKTWRDAYNSDTHVADEYARTNHVEVCIDIPAIFQESIQKGDNVTNTVSFH